MSHLASDVSGWPTVLRDPGAKIDRGVEHTKALDDAIEAFLKEEPYRVISKFEAEAGCHVARIRVTQNPPLRLSTMVGDVAHNLRSALDLIAWQLALDEVGEAAADQGRRQISFPISKAPEDFESHPALAFFSKNAKAVLDYVQPYQRRHVPDDAPTEAEPLAVLDELSKADKHRVLHGAFTALDLSEIRFRPGVIHVEDIQNVRVEQFVRHDNTFEDGTKVAEIHFPGAAPETTDVGVENQPTARILFGEGVGTRTLYALCTAMGWTASQFEGVLAMGAH